MRHNRVPSTPGPLYFIHSCTYFGIFKQFKLFSKTLECGSSLSEPGRTKYWLRKKATSGCSLLRLTPLALKLMARHSKKRGNLLESAITLLGHGDSLDEHYLAVIISGTPLVAAGSCSSEPGIMFAGATSIASAAADEATS